jgi:hypothetical protein
MAYCMLFGYCLGFCTRKQQLILRDFTPAPYTTTSHATSSTSGNGMPLSERMTRPKNF